MLLRHVANSLTAPDTPFQPFKQFLEPFILHLYPSLFFQFHSPLVFIPQNLQDVLGALAVNSAECQNPLQVKLTHVKGEEGGGLILLAVEVRQQPILLLIVVMVI